MIIATVAETFSYLWFGWLLLFVVIEVIALYIKRGKSTPDYSGGTLSELFWRITRGNRLFLAVFSLFWLVLAYHFFFEGQ